MNWGDYFKYCHSTGSLLWKVKPKGSSVQVGDVAGCLNQAGYIVVGIKGKYYKAHRVAWEMVNGPIPEGYEVDHIFHDKTDNRISQLRLVNRTDNNRNKSMAVKNRTGVTGVQFKKNRWEVQISDCKVQYYLGRFDTLFEAAAARKSAELQYSYHPNHGIKL